MEDIYEQLNTLSESEVRDMLVKLLSQGIIINGLLVITIKLP